MVGAYHPESSGRANMGPDLENMILNPMGVLLCYVDQNLPTKSCYEHTGDHQREPSNDACACKLFAQKKRRGHDFRRNLLFFSVGAQGFEPRTLCL